MSTHRIHDLAPLRASIKSNAEDAHRLRAEARLESGPDRHRLKQEAKWPADDTRTMLLAYGYLRGRTIAQMESGHSLPENLPSAQHILGYAAPAFMEGPDVEDALQPTPSPKTKTLNHPDWAEFKARVEADLKSWKAQLILNQQTHAALLRRQKAEEEAA